MNRRPITVLYTQVNVFRREEPNFNLWTNEHVEQGVAWREGHASFGVPDHDGRCLLEWGAPDGVPEILPDVSRLERIIAVPLSVGHAGASIATVGEEIDTGMAPGTYQVRFALEPDVAWEGATYAYRIVVLFERADQPEFVILKPGEDMTADAITLRTAEPTS